MDGLTDPTTVEPENSKSPCNDVKLNSGANTSESSQNNGLLIPSEVKSPIKSSTQSQVEESNGHLSTIIVEPNELATMPQSLQIGSVIPTTSIDLFRIEPNQIILQTVIPIKGDKAAQIQNLIRSNLNRRPNTPFRRKNKENIPVPCKAEPLVKPVLATTTEIDSCCTALNVTEIQDRRMSMVEGIEPIATPIAGFNGLEKFSFVHSLVKK